MRLAGLGELSANRLLGRRALTGAEPGAKLLPRVNKEDWGVPIPPQE